MSKNPFEKFADKLLNRDKKGQDLRKYNINLNSILGDDVDYDEIQYNEHRKLIGTAKICLNNQLHFWMSKNGDFRPRIDDLQHDIRQSANICDRITKKQHTADDITKLRTILTKHGCV